MENPDTHYAMSGDINIAYQTFGQGKQNLVLIPGWASHVELAWNQPEHAAFLRKIATFCRITVLDRRGTGLSDPVSSAPTIEERMDDVRAVMDDAGLETAAIFGISEGGPMAMVFAAAFPERTEALLLFGTFARLAHGEDYEIGLPSEAGKKFLKAIDDYWGQGKSAKIFAPSRANDPAFVKTWAQFERNSMGRGTARQLMGLNYETDVRDVLPMIRVPTQVLHRVGDTAVPLKFGQYISEQIPGAKLVELEGDDHYFANGDTETLIAEVEEFLTGERTAPTPDRILTTVMFADIVQSTERAVDIGDRAWKHLLEQYYAVARKKLGQHNGRELDNAGDGFFASFDGPARAVRCGLELQQGMTPLGLQLRVGVHTGECEIFGDKLSGIAVHLGARIAGKAQPGEVLVSSTVKDLTVGSGIDFGERGEHSLKGVPGEWRLFQAQG